MAKIVFRLASVSDEEAQGVRDALENVGVPFYETPAGKFGWSMPAIWIKNNEDYVIAREVIDKFQEIYVEKVKQESPPLSKPNGVKIVLALILSTMVLYVFNSFWLQYWF